MGAKVTVCCCHCYLKHNRDERNAILRTHKSPASRQAEMLSSESSDSGTEDESLFGQQRSRESPCYSAADRRAAANAPCDVHVRRGSDRELQAFISMRDQADQATEEWEKLNYDIHTLCYARREVRSRWKKILLQLGYQREVDGLLRVNRQSRRSPGPARLRSSAQLLQQLQDHSSLFPPGAAQHDRYLCVMDRLVSLDSAEDFIRLAKEKYPKK